MLERLWEYLSRHVKIALKSVFLNFKQYCCFFAAILIIQLLYGMMAISATNNNTVAYEQIAEEYEYHYVIRNLTQGQYNFLKEYKDTDYGTTDEIRQAYVIVDEIERYNTREQKNEYDVYIRFGKLDRDTGALADTETVKKYYDWFEMNYISQLPSHEPSYEYTNFTTERTLLLEYENRVAANDASFWVITAVLVVLSVFLLTSIYNIRMNQYKFTYGVYMTFGADFKMLFITAFWEMFVIMLVMFIPAVLISTLVVFLIYLPSGFTFSFDGWVILKLFLFSTVVVLASVFMPMRVTSMRNPMSLIITEDNSNLVTSPRKSFNLLGKTFPGHYEMYSLWRFRKYNVQLLTTAIIFCALFICGLYLANIYTTDLNYPRTQFTVEINTDNTGAAYDKALTTAIQDINEDFRAEFKEELQKFDNDKDEAKFSETFNAITGVEATGNATPTSEDLDFGQSPTTELKYQSSYLLVNKKDIKPFASGFFVYDKDDAYSKYEGEGTYKVTNASVVKAVDPNNREDFINFLSQYEIEGDINKIYESTESKNYVIVGDSISNISKFKYEPGDTIAVGSWTGEYVAQVDSNLSGKNLLRRQIKSYKYNFTEFEICAVIKDIPSGSVPVYMVNDVYEDVTGRSSETTKLNLYTYDAKYGEENVFQMNDDHITFIENSLRQMIADDGQSKIGSMVVTDLNQLAENAIKEDEHYNELYIAISVLILCISPIIWFFSQTLYYFKREKEFNIIQSMGANGSDIRKIYLIGGLSMAVLSLIVSIVLSYVASYIMFYAYNVVVPNFSGEYVRYTFYMPWYALVIAVVMSVACGFFSAYLPYKSYFKNRYSLENGGGGKDDD